MLVSVESDPRRIGTIWSFHLDASAPVITPLVEASFGRLEPENAPLLAATIGDTSLAEMIKRFEAGRHCYAAWVDGKPVAQGWISFNDEYIGELDMRIKLLPDEAYIWDCNTAPAYRQRYLYSALLVYMLEELRAERLRRIWIGANLENVASQKGIARAGFQRVADLFIARAVAMRLVWIEEAPDVSDGLVAEARRVFLNSRDKVWLSEQPSLIGR